MPEKVEERCFFDLGVLAVESSISSSVKVRPVAVGLSSEAEDVGTRGGRKKLATFQPSQNQDLLRWSKAVARIST